MTDVIFKAGLPPSEGKHPGLQPRVELHDALVVERDVAIVLRDGVTIYGDVFRPRGDAAVPVLIAWSPYGKHAPVRYERFYRSAGVDPDWVSSLAMFEGPDPAYWVPAGYAVINVDPRGTWYSEGTARFWGERQEGLDGYDVVEWAASQPWCSGKVAFSGVSYLSHIQWRVAAERPPHLAAINPWEGYTDAYRETAYLGGIPDTDFLLRWQRSAAYSVGQIEDVVANAQAHPLFDEYWAGKVSDLSRIEVPAYIVASWSDQGLHTRGTIGAFNAISSERKWLEVHGRKKWETYHSPSWVAKQRRFFDHILKGLDNEVTTWPPVQIEVRQRYYVGHVRAEHEWPPARTRYQKLWLDTANAMMNSKPPEAASSCQYYASADGGQACAAYGYHRVQFDHRFERDTELTGYMRLRLWVHAPDADDMDLFVALQKFDSRGRYVGFAYFGALEDGPVALGWLRASHRELDLQRSTPWQPWHSHQRELRLTPGEIVPVDVELWPSSTTFAKGDVLRLVIQGSDIYRYDMGPVVPTHRSINRGVQVIHAGGDYDSYLLVPEIPKEPE